MSKKDYCVNEQIKSQNVRLVLPSGEMREKCSLQDALDLARQEGLDLVEVDASKGIPVCKILDYGKLKYDAKKKQKKQKSNSQIIKEIRIGYAIDAHDMGVKSRKAIDFLEKKYKVKLTMRLEHRQRRFAADARGRLEEVAKSFDGIASFEPVQQSRNSIWTVLSKV